MKILAIILIATSVLASMVNISIAGDERVYTTGLMEYVGCTTGQRGYYIKPNGKGRIQTTGIHPNWIRYYDFNCVDDDILFENEPSLTMSDFNKQWNKIDGSKLLNETLRKLDESDKFSGYADYLQDRLDTFAKQGLLNELLFVSASSDKILENLRSYPTLDQELALDYLALSVNYSDQVNIFLTELILKRNFLQTKKFGFSRSQLNILEYARPTNMEFFSFQYAKSQRISEIKDRVIQEFKEQVSHTPRHSFMCPNLLKYLQKTLRGGSVYRQGNYNALTYPGYYDNAFQAIPDCKNIYEDKLTYLNVHLEKLRLDAEDRLKGKKIIAIEAIK